MIGRLPDKTACMIPNGEHDSCGVGFVANLDGTKTHQIVKQGLKVLANLHHRGACGCDPETGDRAGILLRCLMIFYVSYRPSPF